MLVSFNKMNCKVSSKVLKKLKEVQLSVCLKKFVS